MEACVRSMLFRSHFTSGVKAQWIKVKRWTPVGFNCPYRSLQYRVDVDKLSEIYLAYGLNPSHHERGPCPAVELY